MTDSSTPICDLIQDLLSPDLSPQNLGQVLTMVRRIEAAMTRLSTSASMSIAARRERERLKKKRQRARNPEMSPGTKNSTLLSNKTQSVLEEKKKEDSAVPYVPGTKPAPTDDWPPDYVEQFWRTFPPFRRQARVKVAAKLAKIRAQKITWETVFGGLQKFAATNPGEYAPAPMVWLNDGRWDRVYGPQGGASNGKTQGAGGFSTVAARLRQRVESAGLPFDDPPPDPRSDR